MPPSGTAFLSPPKMRQPLSSQSQISLHFFLLYKGEKNLSVKLSPQIYSPGPRILLLGKYSCTPHVHPYPHTPDKAPRNDLSRKSLFPAEGQGSFKDAPSFPLVLFTSFFLGPSLGPPSQLRSKSLLPVPQDQDGHFGRPAVRAQQLALCPPFLPGP